MHGPKEKNAFAVESVSGFRKVAARGVERAGVGSPGHSLPLFPLALLSSVSGAWRTVFSVTTSDDRRSVSAGKTDSRDETGARRQKIGELGALL
jgi:hypothetical protein